MILMLPESAVPVTGAARVAWTLTQVSLKSLQQTQEEDEERQRQIIDLC